LRLAVGEYGFAGEAGLPRRDPPTHPQILITRKRVIRDLPVLPSVNTFVFGKIESKLSFCLILSVGR